MSGLNPSPHAALERLGPESFRGLQLARPGTWAIAFLADWCPFCRDFEPEFVRLGGRGFGLGVADVSSDQSPLWERFEIDVVPTVIVFRDGTSTFRAGGRYMEGLDSNDLAAVTAAAAVR